MIETFTHTLTDLRELSGTWNLPSAQPAPADPRWTQALLGYPRLDAPILLGVASVVADGVAKLSLGDANDFADSWFGFELATGLGRDWQRVGAGQPFESVDDVAYWVAETGYPAVISTDTGTRMLHRGGDGVVREFNPADVHPFTFYSAVYGPDAFYDILTRPGQPAYRTDHRTPTIDEHIAVITLGPGGGHPEVDIDNPDAPAGALGNGPDPVAVVSPAEPPAPTATTTPNGGPEDSPTSANGPAAEVEGMAPEASQEDSTSDRAMSGPRRRVLEFAVEVWDEDSPEARLIRTVDDGRWSDAVAMLKISHPDLYAVFAGSFVQKNVPDAHLVRVTGYRLEEMPYRRADAVTELVRHLGSLGDVTAVSDGVTVLALVEEPDGEAAVRRAIDLLSPSIARVAAAAFLEGNSDAEITQSTGFLRKTVEMNRRKGAKQIIELIVAERLFEEVQYNDPERFACALDLLTPDEADVFRVRYLDPARNSVAATALATDLSEKAISPLFWNALHQVVDVLSGGECPPARIAQATVNWAMRHNRKLVKELVGRLTAPGQQAAFRQRYLASKSVKESAKALDTTASSFRPQLSDAVGNVAELLRAASAANGVAGEVDGAGGPAIRLGGSDFVASPPFTEGGAEPPIHLVRILGQVQDAQLLLQDGNGANVCLETELEFIAAHLSPHVRARLRDPLTIKALRDPVAHDRGITFPAAAMLLGAEIADGLVPLRDIAQRVARAGGFSVAAVLNRPGAQPGEAQWHVLTLYRADMLGAKDAAGNPDKTVRIHEWVYPVDEDGTRLQGPPLERDEEFDATEHYPDVEARHYDFDIEGDPVDLIRAAGCRTSAVAIRKVDASAHLNRAADPTSRMRRNRMSRSGHRWTGCAEKPRRHGTSTSTGWVRGSVVSIGWKWRCGKRIRSARTPVRDTVRCSPNWTTVRFRRCRDRNRQPGSLICGTWQPGNWRRCSGAVRHSYPQTLCAGTRCWSSSPRWWKPAIAGISRSNGPPNWPANSRISHGASEST